MPTPRPLYRFLTLWVKQNEWIHLIIGIVGNLTLLTGAILFVMDHAYSGWFFVAGALGMTLNAIGNFITKTEFSGKTTLTDIGLEEYKRRHDSARRCSRHQSVRTPFRRCFGHDGGGIGRSSRDAFACRVCQSYKTSVFLTPHLLAYDSNTLTSIYQCWRATV